MLDFSILDRVIKETLVAIEKSKIEIYEIVEGTADEIERVKAELAAVQAETASVIAQVDEQTRRLKAARRQLVLVSRNFATYNENDIKEAYQAAEKENIKLVQLRETERHLRFRRDDLERRLRQLQEMRERGERLIGRLGVVLNYLCNDLQDLNVKLSEMQQLHQLRLRIIEAQEEERRRLAREIHDGPAQAMANIVMRADFCLKLLELAPAKVSDELVSLQKVIRDCLKEIRKVIFDLRPMVLDDLGLVPALKKFLEEYREQSGLQVEFTFLGEERRLDKRVEVALFRIIQESLRNVQKHARAQKVAVKLEILPHRVNVLIKDDGCGFDVNEVLSGKGEGAYGLIGIRERVQLLDGRLTIRANRGQGTTIAVHIPLGGQEGDRGEDKGGYCGRSHPDSRRGPEDSVAGSPYPRGG